MPRPTLASISIGSLVALFLLTSPLEALAQSEGTPSAGPAAAETATPDAIATPAADMPEPAPETGLTPRPDSTLQGGPVPAARPDPNAPGGVSVDRQALPHDLSPWGMFLVADIVVQGVMIGLVLASVVTWTIWFAKSLELAAARSRTRKALALIGGEASLSDAATKLGDRRGVVSAFVDAAKTELRMSDNGADKAGIKERVESRLDGLRAAAARQMNAGTGLLATIGSTAPFVGLFGTVWGIMNSFIGISEAQTTNLAVVAPGIAEALLATALGLAAAIPAVIIYNYFSRSIAGYRALITDAAAEVMRQLSRDLDRKRTAKPRSVQAAVAAE